MPSILHINASPRKLDSQSLRLARLFLDHVTEHSPDTEVKTLNLFNQGALPVFGATAAQAKMAMFSGQTLTPAQNNAWKSVSAVFDQFAAADAYVFNIPMWNGGVPYVLKQWIDIVTQPGWSFSFDPATGYSGLMKGKHAVAIHTSGVYAPGGEPAFGSDFSSTFFADWLQFVGIEQASHVRFAPTVLNADPDETRLFAEAELTMLAPEFAERLTKAELTV